MIKEAYCSDEVYELLRNNGFNAETQVLYDNEGYTEPVITHQTAMAWLREEHQLHISVDVAPIYGKVKDEKGKNTCGVLYWHYMASGEWMNNRYNPQQKAFVVSEKSYKEAVEAAIKYALEKLI